MEKCLSKRRLEEHQLEFSIITTSNVSDLNCQKNFSYALNQPARHSYFHLAFLLSTGKGFTGY